MPLHSVLKEQIAEEIKFFAETAKNDPSFSPDFGELAEYFKIEF